MSNPNVGILHPVWSPMTGHTDGSMPTYGTGRVLQEARTANITKEIGNNPLYGDDRIVDDDNGVTGITVSFENTGLSMEDRVVLLAEEVDNSGGGTSDDGQWESDTPTPWGGFGYVRVMRENGVVKFDAYLILSLKFQETTQETSTREGQIQWKTPTLDGRAQGLYVDSTGKLRFRKHKLFSTSAAAFAWLDAKLNVPSGTVTT